MLLNLGQEVADIPDEDPGIPEITLRAHFLRARPVRLLDESLDGRAALLVRVGSLYVAEARIGACRDDTNRHERVGLARDLLSAEKGLSVFRIIADEPVGVDGDHHRFLAASTLDGKSSPRQRRRRSGGLWLGDDVFPRYRRKKSPDRFYEARVCEHQRVSGIHDGAEPVDRIHQQWLCGYQ